MNTETKHYIEQIERLEGLNEDEKLTLVDLFKKDIVYVVEDEVKSKCIALVDSGVTEPAEYAAHVFTLRLLRLDVLYTSKINEKIPYGIFVSGVPPLFYSINLNQTKPYEIILVGCDATMASAIYGAIKDLPYEVPTQEMIDALLVELGAVNSLGELSKCTLHEVDTAEAIDKVAGVRRRLASYLQEVAGYDTYAAKTFMVIFEDTAGSFKTPQEIYDEAYT